MSTGIWLCGTRPGIAVGRLGRRGRDRVLTTFAIASLTAGAFALGACSRATDPSSGAEPAVRTVEGWETEAVGTLGATPAPVAITIGLPYRPDVQFTPMYVAERRGYFADEGLAPRFEYGDEAGFVRRVAARDMAAVVASGDQVILARANDIPVTYVATWYERFPGVVFTIEDGIATPSDLIGRRVGLPAVSGASYLGWQALLAANDIDPREIPTEVVGFEQLDAVLRGRVDAAVGYGANEPVQLRLRGQAPTVIEIADSFNLVSNGVVVSDGLIAESPTVVAGIVRAFLRGLADSLADPDGAFDVAMEVVPEIAAPEVRDAQRAVLDASLVYWRSARPGAIDPERWQASQDFLVQAGLITTPSAVGDMIDPTFVDGAFDDR